MQANKRAVKLLKNQLYPTYQLHAFMANKKTTPQDGLRLAALITMDWLWNRLGESAPEEFKSLPAPSEYHTLTDECLFSTHMNSGFVIDIVSLPGSGIWTLQITEPDLGSDPGNPQQLRQAVPGRIIETNVGFKITGSELECGFQTVISDPEGTAQQAEVYRLAIVRQLLNHPDFGLKQITVLNQEVTQITSVSQLKALTTLWRSPDNQLPCVIFTHIRKNTPPAELPPLPSAPLSYRPALPLPPKTLPSKAVTAAPPDYDYPKFARSCTTFCRTYLLADDLLDRLNTTLKRSVNPGDILVLEPPMYGCAVFIVPYKSDERRRAELLAGLKREMMEYPRGKEIDYGQISFLSAAREGLLLSTREAILQSREASSHWAQELIRLENQWKAELQKKEAETLALTEQLNRNKQYQARLEEEKTQIRTEADKEAQRLQAIIAQKDADIAYLKRKLCQPREHSGITAWAEEHFGGKLLIHPRAVAMLEDKSARTVSIELICDALDFLATDYWDRRYLRIPEDEMNSRCSKKYGRPFDVKPVGSTTIEFTPSQYKIKYFIGPQGKPVDSDLDAHLRVGNDPENLLRIYFLHDDEKQLIVIGSLPKHLRAVTIQ